MIKRLMEHWQGSGIEKGDTILIHTSLKRTFQNFNCTPDDVIESFLNILGPTGTLILPTFNFGFGNGLPFDAVNTPSEMGIVTEVARLRDDFVRTLHPIYSFAVKGLHQDKFENLDNYGGYDKNSPFGLLRELGGKIGVIDLPEQLSMTFYHHIEEMNNVNYRYHKKFVGEYTNFDGITTIREYGLFVRKLEENIKTNINPSGDLLWENGLYKGNRPFFKNGLRTINANEMFDFVTNNIIKKDSAKGLLYIIGD